MKTLPAIAVAALAMTIPGAAHAQDLFADPNSGTIELSANFETDPTTMEVISGGEIDVSTQVAGCTGLISNAPDVRLSFSAGGEPSNYPLFISVTSDGDTTLVVNAPDGSWYCNDDREPGNTNPRVIFGPAQSGNYEIWIGSFEEGEFIEATLKISELNAE